MTGGVLILLSITSWPIAVIPDPGAAKPVQPEDLPSLCGAIVGLLHKWDSVVPNGSEERATLAMVMHLAQMKS